MSIAVLVIADGRDDYLHRTLASLDEQVTGTITERWMHDDTGDATYRADLAARYPAWRHINAGPDRAGCAGAFRSCWRQLRDGSTAGHVFMLEQDFTFNRPVNLDEMVGLLDTHPHLAEVALVRQPWNDAEVAAGGVLELHPDWYTDMTDDQGRAWLEHAAFFTTNPCVFRRTLLTVDWPAHRDGCFSEGTFHQQLMAEGTPEVPGDRVRYAYWGRRSDGPWVTHIGVNRAGVGY